MKINISPLCKYGSKYPPNILERSCIPIYAPVLCSYTVVDIYHAYCICFNDPKMPEIYVLFLWEVFPIHIGKVLHPKICTSPLCIYGGRYPPRVLEWSCIPNYAPVHCPYTVVDIHRAYWIGNHEDCE